MKQKLRVYIDTSVIGGYLDTEFEKVSKVLIERFKNGELIAVISEITELELQKAPEDVRKIINTIPEENIDNVELTEEAVMLAQEYINEGILGIDKIADAQHIAIATVNKVDLILSWNFKHIVNIEKIRGFNAVNLKRGYSIIDIRSPQEAISYE